MRIIVGCRDKKTLEELKRALEAQGHTVLAVSSRESWQNLVNAGYHTKTEAVIAEHVLGGILGHDLVMGVNCYLPALIFNVKDSWFNKIANALLTRVSLPNTRFISGQVGVANIGEHLTRLVPTLVSEEV